MSVTCLPAATPSPASRASSPALGEVVSRARPRPRLLSRLALGGAAIGLLGAALVSPALAQDPVFVDAAQQTRAYWNAGQLMRATPLDTPTAAASMQDLLESNAAGAGSALEDQVAGYGGYVADEDVIAPDMDARIHPQLAGGREAALPELGEDPDPADAVTPQDVGSSAAYFSSSRLVPTDARLYYPYSAVGKLFFTEPGVGNFVCSAAVLRPRIILTAGHCVHRGSGGSGGFFTNFLFVPAFHQGLAPFQQWNWAYAITTASWASSNGNVPNRSDFGILVVGDRSFNGVPTRIGQVTGYLGYRTNALLPNHVKIIGYPVNFDGGQIEHQVDAQDAGAAGQGTVIYGSDMRGGSSGGPWIENFGNPAVGQTGGYRFFPNYVVGVTSYGPIATDPMYQGASPLNQEFLDILNTACNQAPGNC